MPPSFETVSFNGAVLGYILRAGWTPEQTTFLTPDELPFQLGCIVYLRDSTIAPHVHKPIQRSIIGTPEALWVKQGRCMVDFYNDQRDLVASREIGRDDFLLIVSGGHGFRMLEDTVLLEIKQGPYIGLEEKERF